MIQRVVHLVVHGLAACGFSKEIPANWPLGHVAVHPEENYYLANCRTCQKLVPPPQPDDEGLPWGILL